MQTIVVVDHDPMWPDIYEQLRTHVWSVLHDVALTVEHVGSTSVPGTAAKPIIDMSVIVASRGEVPLAIARQEVAAHEGVGTWKKGLMICAERVLWAAVPAPEDWFSG